MKKRISNRKLSREKAHRESMIRNQMRSLLTYGFLVTTTPRAKVLKGKIESFLHKLKEDNLETKRRAHSLLGEKKIVQKTLEYAKKEEKSKVGIVKYGFRDGDNAELSKVTLFDYAGEKTKQRPVKTKRKKGKGETEFVEEKKDDKVLEKGNIEKESLNIKEKFVSKERARSRSGI